MVVPMIGTPAVASSRRLRALALNGFGRLFRGTAHAVFIAYWTACATERAVERADDADHQPDRTPADAARFAEFAADHRELAQGRVQHPLLQCRITAEHEPEHRGQQQEQREQRHERVVGDECC